ASRPPHFSSHDPLPIFTQLVEEASPAVVNISTRQNVPRRSAGMGPMVPDLEGLPPIFREFFERSFPDGPQAPPQRQAQSLGSGLDRKSTRLNSSHVKIS